MNSLDIYDFLVPAVCPLYAEAIELFVERTKHVCSAVELGVGTGRVASAILEYSPSIQYVGYDHSAAALEIARRKLMQHHCRLIEADFKSVDLPSADIILSSLAIHHLTIENQYCLLKRIQKSYRTFIHFELVELPTSEEKEKKEDYILDRAKQASKELGVPFTEIETLLETSSKHDNPLTIDEHIRIHEVCGVELEILLDGQGFVMYQTHKKPK